MISKILVTILISQVVVAHAMLPPPVLRSVCGAFADAEEAVGNKALAAGKAAVDMAMKPIAIVGGLKAAAVGTGMKMSGGAMKFVGAKLAKDGLMMEAAGAGIKGAGLGVAAMAVKPMAEKVVAASTAAEGSVKAASAVAENMISKVGDTSIQIDATLDSPLIGHHHKEVNVIAGLEANHNQVQMTEQHGETKTEQHVEQQQQQVEQVSPKAKRAAKIDKDVMNAAMNLVKDAKLQDCVARAICDLNCDPQGYGQDGKQVFMNMVRLQGAKGILDEADSKFFHDAANKGRQSSSSCSQCSETYQECNSKSSDLIKMASHIRLD